MIVKYGVAEAVAPAEVFCKKGFLKNFENSQENTCTRVSFLIKLKETLAQVFSCEFCEIFKNTFFTEHPRATASVYLKAHRQIPKKRYFEKYCSCDQAYQFSAL